MTMKKLSEAIEDAEDDLWGQDLKISALRELAAMARELEARGAENERLAATYLAECVRLRQEQDKVREANKALTTHGAHPEVLSEITVRIRENERLRQAFDGVQDDDHRMWDGGHSVNDLNDALRDAMKGGAK